MGRRHLASALVVCVLTVVGVVAAVDAARSRDAVDRPTSPPQGTAREDTADTPAATLETERIRGVLYYSDPEDECRVHAVELPELAQASPPTLRTCRFELPREPGTGAVANLDAWNPDGRLGAACHDGRIVIATPSGAPVARLDGCAPAWRPDGTLTAVRDGEVWCLRTAGNEVCERRLLSTAQLAEAAHAVRYVPTGPRYLRSVQAVRVAWLDETRSAVLVRVRLRGRLGALSPVTVLALYEGTRLLQATEYAGAVGLRTSPRRSFVAVNQAGGQVAVVTRSGDQLLGAGDLPSPRAHAVAWSPDERWIAVATRWSVYLLPTADLEADRQPRIIRLPLAVGDLAWR